MEGRKEVKMQGKERVTREIQICRKEEKGDPGRLLRGNLLNRTQKKGGGRRG